MQTIDIMKTIIEKVANVALPALGLFAAILLPYLVRNAYVAIFGIFAISLGIFVFSKKLEGSMKAVAYGLAFACLVIAAGVPSGEIGRSPCPEKKYSFGDYGTISYFQSPFCINCAGQESVIAKAANDAKFDVDIYDLRYCKNDAAKYGFYATPCFAVEIGNITLRSCGPKTENEIKALLDEAVGSSKKSGENKDAE